MSLKIISGVAKGMVLQSPKNARPSSAILREALISLLKHNDLFSGDYHNMLDLCAGSGAVGLELLSNNICQDGDFVESDKQNIPALQHNIDKVGQKLANPIRLLKHDAYQLKPNMLKELPGLIFTDPPYNQDAETLVHHLHQSGLLAQCKLLMVQTAPDVKLNQIPPTLSLLDTKKYGNAALHFYRCMTA